DQLYRHKILAHLDRREYESIWQLAIELDGSPGSGGSEVSRAIGAKLDEIARELREMAALYALDRYALLRVNRAFDLVGRVRRGLTFRRTATDHPVRIDAWITRQVQRGRHLIEPVRTGWRRSMGDARNIGRRLCIATSSTLEGVAPHHVVDALDRV